ncbi:MAG: carboxylating nicotinate-nucleotide diphosphorylase [Gammaproteobacteria bacterium]
MLLEALDQQLHATVRNALEEDLGKGDITAELVPRDVIAKAKLISRETGVLCGINWFNTVFQELDDTVQITWAVQDGETVRPNQILCTLTGPARPLLSGERTALNFLQTLSGTATLARQYADAVRDYPAVKILDTRKTLPGLRAAQKYAVLTGGCHNHRMGLYDGILIKDNHIRAAGSVEAAIHAARAVNRDVPIEVEVATIEQLEEALDAGADILLLDNFDLAGLRAAVAFNAGRAKLEASGGINLENVAAVAATEVDYISIGALTKDVRALDLSMQFE